MKKFLTKAFNRSSKSIYEGKWLRLKTVNYMIKDKELESYEYIERCTRKKDFDGIDIIPIITYNHSKQPPKFILIANYRPPVGNYVLEWPAGLVNNTDKFEEDALRELKEETGFIPKTLENMSEFLKGIPLSSPVLYGDPWKSNECGKSIILEVDGDDQRNIECKQTLEETEDIYVHLVDLKHTMIRDLEKLAKDNNYLISAKVYGVMRGILLGSSLRSIL